jgi:hypothetical protein
MLVVMAQTFLNKCCVCLGGIGINIACDVCGRCFHSDCMGASRSVPYVIANNSLCYIRISSYFQGLGKENLLGSCHLARRIHFQGVLIKFLPFFWYVVVSSAGNSDTMPIGNNYVV